MIRNRAVVGLSLLCALAFCVIAASSASAADGKGTTQFTCVEGGGEKDFTDNHCKEFVGPEKGKFGHVAVKLNETTPIDSVQTENAVLTSTIGGLKAIITCKKIAGTGSATNSEPSAGIHRVTGTKIKTVYSECTSTIGGVACPVAGGKIEVPNAISVDVEGAHGFKMGIKVEPAEAGKPFTTLSLGPCKATGEMVQAFSIEGSALALPEGSTGKFTKASTEPTLKFGGQKASLVSTVTLTNEVSKTPIVTTTTDKDRAN